jgi:alpha-2-macroglobulin
MPISAVSAMPIMETPMFRPLFAFGLFLLVTLSAAAQIRDLRVVGTKPEGPTASIRQSQTVFAIFSEPMVPLQARPKDEGSGPITLTPAVKGKYRWMGTSTISFIPDSLLPNATGFTVRIPAGTKSQGGAVLASEVSWTFETPRPLITWSWPAAGQAHVDTNTGILLRFNQPVDPTSVSKFISIRVNRPGSPETYPGFTASRPDTSQKIDRPEEVVALRVLTPFGLQASVGILVKAGVTGIEGPLPMTADHSVDFMTFGELTFNGIDQEPIYPGTGIMLNFSNGVSPAELLKHLTFNPALKTQQEYYENTYPSERVYIPLPLKPESTYTVTLSSGLKDMFGMTLKADHRFNFTVQPYLPFVRTRTGVGVLEGTESHKFPVSTMNIDSFRVQMGEVNPGRIVPLMQKFSWDYYTKLAVDEGILLRPTSLSEEGKAFTRNRTLPTNMKRNTVMVKPLDFDDVIGKGGRGVVLVQVDDMNESQPAFLKTLVQVTDMGVTGKFSPQSNLIWVTTLKDAAPVADAAVEIRNDSNQVVWTGTTDAKGLVKTPGWGKLKMGRPQEPSGNGEEGEDEPYDGGYGAQPRQWVIVTKGTDIAFTSSDWNEGIEPYRFDISYDWSPRAESYEGELFTDRGLYKAGERVDIKAIVRKRDEDQWKLVPSMKVRVVVKNSRNEEIFTEEKKLSAFSSCSSALQLKPSSPLGYYSMSLQYAAAGRGKKRWKMIQNGSFRVEAFRAAEFDVTAKFGRESYTIGDTTTGMISSRYLFGSPMKNASIRWRLSASRSSFTPQGWDGYFFDKLGWLTHYQNDFSWRELMNKDTTLDDLGILAIRSPLRVGELRGPISLSLEGEVTSPTRQTLSGRASVVLHQGDFYIGLKPSSTFVKADTTMSVAIIAASKEGIPVPDRNLTVRILQRVWNSVRKAETGGRYAWYSVEADTLLDSSIVTTSGQPVQKQFTPKGPGFFYVDVTGTDARGNQLSAQTYFYATGSGYVPWERRNDDRIDLIADKTSLKPGDTASIIVKNPYEKATALVSIEREGILSHFTTTVEGGAPTIRIPITQDHLPNIFVSVVLLQGRTGRPPKNEAGDVGRPSFKVGYIALSVNPRQKKLDVAVESSRKEYRPGDTVEVTIRVKDAAGKPQKAEVVLSVPDLGVLNLIGYRLPNPFDTFYHERPLAVVTTETRMHIIEQRSYDEKGQEVGGGGAAKMAEAPDADGIRKDFRPSAYWNPSLITDSLGIARARFKLPDNLTSFEMMAVAHTKTTDVGYGEGSFTVNKPLLLQPSLPRFARVGDAFKSGVVIMNATDREEKIDLKTTVAGITWNNEESTSHTLKPGEAREVLFAFKAEKTGVAKFIFRARSESNYDGLQWTIPVTVPRMKETVALFESTTEPSKEEHVATPTDVYPDLGGIEFTASSTAMVGLKEGISYLFTYPYGCIEQRASAVLPMILAKDLVDAFHFEVVKDKDYRSVVTKTLDELPLFQRSNGGFSYWKNTEKTWCYVSAYALYTLVQGEKNGYPVDKHAVKAGLEYLKRFLHGDERDEMCISKYYVQATSALALYTLALAGTPEHGYMENLYKQRGDMPLFPKAYLLRALHAANGKASMQDELVRDLSNKIKIAPTSAHFEEDSKYDMWWCFDSNTRTTALIMQALVETQPESPLVPKIVRWLIDQQKAGRWRTTQENLYVVDALATYLRAYEKDEPDFKASVTLEGKTILDELFKGRSFNVVRCDAAMSDLTKGKDYPVTISRTGTGRLYYGIRMNYYPLGETAPKDEGFSVVKTIEPLAGGSADTVRAGAMLKVTLTVSSKQFRHFVALEDPVPAGCEVVNSSFATTSEAYGGAEGEQSDDWYDHAFNHNEKYDDRVLLFADNFTPGAHVYTYLIQAVRAGSFRVPATKVEGMYEPEVFGQTGSTSIQIK